jgi:NADH:ubiquinone oxidoreductase subunit C
MLFYNNYYIHWILHKFILQFNFCFNSYSFIELHIKKTSLLLNTSKYVIISIFNIFKKHLLFKLNCLVDTAVYDVPSKKFRFKLMYALVSIQYCFLFKVSFISTIHNSMNTLTSVFKSSNWVEREIWDLYGIFFIGHSDLRRILTDYGFKGHALRKDFPLSGYFQVFYSNLLKKVRYNLLTLQLEF